MSKAAELAALIGSQSSLANPNMIINGDMAISQRATSLSGQTGTSIKCVDRFTIVEGADAAFDVAQSSTAPDGFNNSLKIDTATADTSLSSTQFASVFQRLEGLDVQQLLWGTSSAKSITLSFYVRSNVTGTYSVVLNAADASSGYQSQTYSISSANTWEKKTITFIGETTTAIPDDNTNAFAVDWCLGSGTGYTSGGATGQAWSSDVTKFFGGQAVNIMSSTDNEWLLTGVQLEIGEVATPFKYESHEYNLSRCQRYYSEVGFGSYGAVCIGQYTFNPSTNMGTTLLGPVGGGKKMRATPTMTLSSAASNIATGATDGSTTALTALAIRSHGEGGVVQLQASAGSAFGADDIQLRTGATSIVFEFDAEL